MWFECLPTATLQAETTDSMGCLRSSLGDEILVPTAGGCWERKAVLCSAGFCERKATQEASRLHRQCQGPSGCLSHTGIIAQVRKQAAPAAPR